MPGLLPLSLVTQGPPAPLAPACGECGLLRACQTPKMAVYGRGKAGVLIVGPAPTEAGDKAGKPSIGKGMTLLKEVLAAEGLDLFQDCWMTTAQACAGRGNESVKNCKPLLLNRIKELNPKVVILLGQEATWAVVSHLWKNNTGEFDRWPGWAIPARPWNCWVCPTYNPTHVEENEYNPAYRLFLKQHLKAAVAKAAKRPWKGSPPDYEKWCTVITDDREAAECLRTITERPVGPLAWDFETNGLKPDNDDMVAASCSVAFKSESMTGPAAFAFPWTRRTHKAMKLLLESPCPKIASNMKFEDRWARKLGIKVRNWWHDTQLAAHVLDNRKAVTSIKFQAFVLLGMPDYDSTVKPFLEAAESGGYAKNRVFRCDWRTLLIYNAMDSLLEYEVARVQRKLLRAD